jgi:multidrug efflux pump subunit AcrA (membrane-fusion protein)
MEKLKLPVIIAAILCLTSLTAAHEGEAQSNTRSPVAVAENSVQFHVISVGGRLQPKSRIVHYTPNSGIVSAVSVEEGQLVESGQKLFSIKRKDDVMNSYKPTVVSARIAGWVSNVEIQVEDEVEANDPAVVIIGTEGYALDVAISDKDTFKVQIGQRVSARTNGGNRITGVLVNRSQEPDYDTGLFSLSFYFPNTQRTFIGEFVVIDLPVDRAKGLFVRRDLIIRRYGKYFLWTVNEEQTLAAREVVLGPTYGDMVLIEQGLAAGERYLTVLTGREKEGDTVEVPEK